MPYADKQKKVSQWRKWYLENRDKKLEYAIRYYNENHETVRTKQNASRAVRGGRVFTAKPITRRIAAAVSDDELDRIALNDPIVREGRT